MPNHLLRNYPNSTKFTEEAESVITLDMTSLGSNGVTVVDFTSFYNNTS